MQKQIMAPKDIRDALDDERAVRILTVTNKGVDTSIRHQVAKRTHKALVRASLSLVEGGLNEQA